MPPTLYVLTAQNRSGELRLGQRGRALGVPIPALAAASAGSSSHIDIRCYKHRPTPRACERGGPGLASAPAGARDPGPHIGGWPCRHQPSHSRKPQLAGKVQATRALLIQPSSHDNKVSPAARVFPVPYPEPSAPMILMTRAN